LRFTQGEATPLCVSPYHEVSVMKLGEGMIFKGGAEK
jgi:hypothetical protein